MSRTDYDYTMMSTFNTCRRRYDYRINQGLVPRREAKALTFGGAIHKALDVWHTTRDLPQAQAAFTANYTEDLENDDKRTNKMGEWVLKNYSTVYAHEPWKLVASEMAFETPLPNGNKLIGRIDKIVEWDKHLWVVDHKTTSSLGPSFMRMAEPNLQFTGYVWAAKQLGYPVVGIILDAVLVAKGLLESSSRARLTPLARFDSYRSPAILEEYVKTVTNIQQAIRRCEDDSEWYPNYDACVYYGECPYRRICVEDPSVRSKVTSAEYTQDHWDPRHKEEPAS